MQDYLGVGFLSKMGIRRWSWIVFFILFFFLIQSIFVFGAESVFNDFENEINGVRFLMSGQESRRMHVENGRVVIGVRDSLLSSSEYIPTIEEPLEVSFIARFPKHDSLYIFSRSEGSTSVGGYRSSNEVRISFDSGSGVIRIREVNGGSWKAIKVLENVHIPLNEDVNIQYIDDGSKITVKIGEYTVSGATSRSYSKNYFGISNWVEPIQIDNFRITHGIEEELEPVVEIQEIELVNDKVLINTADVLSNNFDGNVFEGLRFLMSGQENRRMHVANNELVMGVRDTLLSIDEYVPTLETPLEISLSSRFPRVDSLYIVTRSDGTTDLGGYRSNNEVRIELDTAGMVLSISEVLNGGTKRIAELKNVVIPNNEDFNVHVKDDGDIVTVTIGDYRIAGTPTGNYPNNLVGFSNWAAPLIVDNLIISQGIEVVVEELEEEDTFLTDTQISNQVLQRLQGAQLLEKSVFAVSGNSLEPLLQKSLPDIFPEDLNKYIQEKAQQRNERGGVIQDRILSQQSEYRGIIRSLMGHYEQSMIDLLNQGVNMVAKVRAGESERNLMDDLKHSLGIASTRRYLRELAWFGIHLPSAEELYRESNRLFDEEQDLLKHNQEEEIRLAENAKFEELKIESQKSAELIFTENAIEELVESLQLQEVKEFYSGMIQVASSDDATVFTWVGPEDIKPYYLSFEYDDHEKRYIFTNFLKYKENLIFRDVEGLEVYKEFYESAPVNLQKIVVACSQFSRVFFAPKVAATGLFCQVIDTCVFERDASGCLADEGFFILDRLTGKYIPPGTLNALDYFSEHIIPKVQFYVDEVYNLPTP
mgnify:CR=1 FL=1